MVSFVTKSNRFSAVLTALVVLVFSSMAFSAAISSNGSGGGAWNSGATWSGGVVPSAADDVTILGTDAVTLDVSTTVNSLTINTGGALHFGSTSGTFTLTVSGNVTNSGTIDTDDGGIAFHTLYIGGNFNNTGGTFNGNQLGGTNPEAIYVDFNGTSAMVISGSPTFYRLIFSGSGSLTTSSSSMLVQSQLDLQSTAGVFTVGSGELTIDAATINIYNAGFDATTNLSTITFTGTSAKTIDVDGSVAALQTITFYNVNVEGADVTLKGTNAAVTFQFDNTLTLTDQQLLFNGTNESIAYGSSATVVYNGSSAQTTGVEWTTPAGTNIAPANVTVDNSAGLSLGSTTLTALSGTLNLQNGAVDYSAGSQLLIVGGVAGTSLGSFGLANDNELQLSAGGTITTSGTPKFHDITTLGNATLTNNFEIQGTLKVSGGGTVTVGGIFTLGTDGVSHGSINVDNGTLDLAGYDIVEDASSALTVGASGTLKTGGTDITSYGGGYSLAGTVEFNGTSAETIPAVSTIGTLVVNNSAGVATSAGTLTVSTALTLTDGTITTTSSNLLRLGDGITVTRTDNTDFIIGPLQKVFGTDVTFTFPVGYTSTYLPAVYTYTGLSGTAVIQVEAVSGSPGGTAPTGISSIATSHYYTLQEITAPTSYTSYAIEITWTGSGFSQNRNQILVQNGVGPTYTYTSGQTHTTTTVALSGLTSYPTDDHILAIGSSSSTIVWTGSAGDGLWSTAGNWDLNEEPQTGDDVEFSGSYSTTQNVEYDALAGASEFASITINPASGAVNLTLNKSALNLTATSNALVVNSGSKLIFGTTTLQMGGGAYDPTLTTYSGTVEYTSAAVFIDDYTDLNINGATGTSGTGTITVSGTLTKSGADFSTTESCSTAAYINTAGAATFSGTSLVVTGTTTLNGGTLGGTVQVQGDVVFGGGSAVGTFTFAGANAQAISGSGAAFENMTINKTSNGVTCSTPVAVSGVLTLTAGDVITTSTNKLTLGTAASYSGGGDNSHVNGPLARATNSDITSYEFPVGNGALQRRVRIAPTSTAADTFTVELVYGGNGGQDVSTNYGTGINHVSSLYYWNITHTTSVAARVTLFWESTNDGVSNGNESELLVAQFDGTQWVDRGGLNNYTGDYTFGSVQSNTVTISSGTNPQFVLATSTPDNSLPVELASFEASVDYGKVTLNWSTASEVNNQGFNIYRKNNETQSWQQINTELIPGQGNSSQESNYTFVDTRVTAGATYFYKLESVSLTGLRVEERTVEVAVPVPTDYALLNNYPNPFNPTTHLRFRLPEAQRVTLSIYDMRGQLIKHLIRNSEYPAGEYEQTWDATDMNGRRVSSGMYLYIFKAGAFQKVGKMVLLK